MIVPFRMDMDSCWCGPFDMEREGLLKAKFSDWVSRPEIRAVLGRPLRWKSVDAAEIVVGGSRRCFMWAFEDDNGNAVMLCLDGGRRLLNSFNLGRQPPERMVFAPGHDRVLYGGNWIVVENLGGGLSFRAEPAPESLLVESFQRSILKEGLSKIAVGPNGWTAAEGGIVISPSGEKEAVFPEVLEIGGARYSGGGLLPLGWDSLQIWWALYDPKWGSFHALIRQPVPADFSGFSELKKSAKDFEVHPVSEELRNKWAHDPNIIRTRPGPNGWWALVLGSYHSDLKQIDLAFLYRIPLASADLIFRALGFSDSFFNPHYGSISVSESGLIVPVELHKGWDTPRRGVYRGFGLLMFDEIETTVRNWDWKRKMVTIEPVVHDVLFNGSVIPFDVTCTVSWESTGDLLVFIQDDGTAYTVSREGLPIWKPVSDRTRVEELVRLAERNVGAGG